MQEQKRLRRGVASEDLRVESARARSSGACACAWYASVCVCPLYVAVPYVWLCLTCAHVCVPWSCAWALHVSVLWMRRRLCLVAVCVPCLCQCSVCVPGPWRCLWLMCVRALCVRPCSAQLWKGREPEAQRRFCSLVVCKGNFIRLSVRWLSAIRAYRIPYVHTGVFLSMVVEMRVQKIIAQGCRGTS